MFPLDNFPSDKFPLDKFLVDMFLGRQVPGWTSSRKDKLGLGGGGDFLGKPLDSFVLDIYCQHLGNIFQLKGFCAPFGRRVEECTILYMYIYWI